jgi:hypothetical protein
MMLSMGLSTAPVMLLLLKELLLLMPLPFGVV